MLYANEINFFRVKEEVFWRNYFYRVSLIKQSVQLSTLSSGQLLIMINY